MFDRDVLVATGVLQETELPRPSDVIGATFVLRETGKELARADVGGCSDEELFEVVRAIGELVSFAEVARAHVLDELDVRGATDRVFGMKTASWAAATTGAARGPIRAGLQVGRALRTSFDLIDDAICDGALHFDHARALTEVSNPRCVDGLVAAQEQIIGLAEGATFQRWKSDVSALAALADADGVAPDPYADNKLRLPQTLEGRTEMNGTFDAANGLVLRTAIDAKADELFRRFTRDHESSPDIDIPGRATLRALALIELLREASGAAAYSGVAPRAEVTLIAHDHETCDAAGNPVPKSAVDVWGCDPEIWGVLVNKMGVPIDVGHRNRLATTAQRHAISVRDGGCTFPGCDAPINWCDLHHVTPWQQGGKTDLANLVALCRHHHGVTHRVGWTLTLDDHELPHWVTPSGRTIDGQRHQRKPPSGNDGPAP